MERIKSDYDEIVSKLKFFFDDKLDLMDEKFTKDHEMLREMSFEYTDMYHDLHDNVFNVHLLKSVGVVQNSIEKTPKKEPLRSKTPIKAEFVKKQNAPTPTGNERSKTPIHQSNLKTSRETPISTTTSIQVKKSVIKQTKQINTRDLTPTPTKKSRALDVSVNSNHDNKSHMNSNNPKENAKVLSHKSSKRTTTTTIPTITKDVTIKSNKRHTVNTGVDLKQKETNEFEFEMNLDQRIEDIVDPSISIDFENGKNLSDFVKGKNKSKTINIDKQNIFHNNPVECMYLLFNSS
jgi:hypothetical protein